MKTTHKLLIAIICGLFTIGSLSIAHAQKLSTKETEQLAKEVYLYGLQQVIFYGTRYNYTQNEGSKVYQGVNRWDVVNNGDPIDASFTSIVTPNATTAYAIGFLDLQDEPVVLEMPEVTDRYFALQLMDQYGVFWLYAGNQFNGTRARTYLIIPEDYQDKIPAQFTTTEIIKTPTKTLTGIIRYARKDPGSKDEGQLIKNLLAQSTVTPLSQWQANGNKGVSRNQQKIVKANYAVFPRIKELTTGQVDKQTGQDFFTYLDLILNDPSMVKMTDSVKEQAILSHLEKVGLGEGLDFDWSKLDGKTQQALTAGFEAGRKLIKASVKDFLIDMNSWGLIRNNGGFATDWMARAFMADFGWLGPDRNISHAAAFQFKDAKGQPLNGSKRYTITFDMKDLPPVSQFWSLPIYDINGYFVDNAIDRYSINSFQLESGLLHVEDGKLVIYVQHDKPSDSKQLKNWLPAPKQDFRLTPRFYGPKMGIIDGSYNMPNFVQVK